MLDIVYSDPIVREYVVRQLSRMKDRDFDQYLLQMVQVLKYEAYHDSPLGRMLVRRALQSPYKIGHNFYWLLKVSERSERAMRKASILEMSQMVT